MGAKVKINKAAAAVDAEAHELTNITVKEVSVVDRAANKRRFLVTKTETPVTDPADVTKGMDDDDLDLTTLPPVAKDAPVKAPETPAVAKTAEPAPVVAPVPAVAPVVPVDALKSLQDMAASVVEAPVVEPAVATQKDDAPAEVVVVSAPAPLSLSAETLKTAILSGIDLIATKIGEWRKAVEAADKNNTDVSGRPYCMWEYSYYLERMIENLSGIGGPEWDVLNATIGKVAKTDITKAGNKAITAARVGVLKGVHEGMQHCTGAMTKVMKELTDEAVADETVTPDASASFAKAAPAAAPSTDPALLTKLAEMEARITKADGVIASLRSIAEAQATAIAKSQAMHVTSNVISSDNEKVQKSKSDDDNLKWSDDLDLAPPRPSGPRKMIF